MVNERASPQKITASERGNEFRVCGTRASTTLIDVEELVGIAQDVAEVDQGRVVFGAVRAVRLRLWHVGLVIEEEDGFGHLIRLGLAADGAGTENAAVLNCEY